MKYQPCCLWAFTNFKAAGKTFIGIFSCCSHSSQEQMEKLWMTKDPDPPPEKSDQNKTRLLLRKKTNATWKLKKPKCDPQNSFNCQNFFYACSCCQRQRMLAKMQTCKQQRKELSYPEDQLNRCWSAPQDTKHWAGDITMSGQVTHLFPFVTQGCMGTSPVVPTEPCGSMYNPGNSDNWKSLDVPWQRIHPPAKILSLPGAAAARGIKGFWRLWAQSLLWLAHSQCWRLLLHSSQVLECAHVTYVANHLGY